MKIRRYIRPYVTRVQDVVATLHTRHMARESKGVEFFTRQLASRVPFTFSRYGDGEWAAILGRSGSNCDGHEYFAEMGQELREAIARPLPYFYGIQQHAIRTYGHRIGRFLSRHHVSITWYDSDVFHRANRDGQLGPFVAELTKHPLVLIGPDHLRALSNRGIEYVDFVEVPSRNCFLACDETIERIRAVAKGKEKVFYSFSASMATNVMIHRLYPELGDRNWLFDAGSIWDGYVDVPSRSYFNNDNWSAVARENLGHDAIRQDMES